jgi:hypothetical protein
MDAPDIPVLSIDDAAVVMSALGVVIARMEEREIDQKAPYTALPRGTLTCGEACMIVGAASLLLMHAYPRLHDPAVAAAALRSAMLTNHFPGKVN